MKISVLIATILTICLSGQAQNLAVEACNDFLQVRQIPGSNEELQRYFSEYASSDTVYAIVFPPANCPRCEAIINPIVQGLKKIRPTTPTILVSVYPDAEAAKQYIEHYSFVADYYQYDEIYAYKGFLSFNAGDLHIPYLLKVVPTTGELLIGIKAESNDMDLLRDFCSYGGSIDKKAYELSKPHSGHFQPCDSVLTIKQTFRMVYPDSLNLSEIINQMEFYGNKLFFNDKLREAIEYFRVSANDSSVIEFCRELRTNSDQNRTFVQVADNIYTSMLEENGVRFIALSPKMLDDRTVAISYSLPCLWYVDTNQIGYKNQSCVLLIDTETLTSRVMPFVKDNNDGFFYPHFSLSTVGDQLAIGCERLTWPIEVDKEEYCDNTEFNPFADGFYDYKQPIMALFDSHNGQMKERIGNLPSLARATRTGYYYTNPVIDSRNGRAAMADGFSGRIDLFDIGDTTNVEHLNAFTIPSALITSPDSTLFYSYDCVVWYSPKIDRQGRFLSQGISRQCEPESSLGVKDCGVRRPTIL